MSRVTVRLVRDDGKSITPFCSGVSIGPNEILTAGHCYSGAGTESYKKGQIFAEFYDLSKSSAVKRIQITNVSFETSDARDLALMKIAQDAPTGFSIPLALNGCDANSPMISAGFGTQTPRSESMSSRAKISEYSADDASAKAKTGSKGIASWFQSWLKVSGPETGKLVLKSVNGKVCFGDSGGPVFCKSRGRLAVVGINGQIDGYEGWKGPFTITNKARYCEKMSKLFITPVQKEMSIISKWRNAAQDSKGDPMVQPADQPTIQPTIHPASHPTTR